MQKESKWLYGLYGVVLTVVLAIMSNFLAKLIPNGYVSASVIAMLTGMMIHPYVKSKLPSFIGIDYVAKKLLKFSIILMGASLSLTQVFEVGQFSLIVMVFTLATAFGFGNLIGRWFKLDWKLSNLISAGTGICGGVLLQLFHQQLMLRMKMLLMHFQRLSSSTY